jgi:hypothetical protein
MSEENELFEQFQNIQAEGQIEVAPVQAMEGIGETAANALGSLWDALTPAFELGADELSRAMFNGNTFVFNGDSIPEQMQSPEIEAPVIEAPQQELERGGIEM